jgi:RNA polymerase sigma-70 factor (ECF subfamily)
VASVVTASSSATGSDADSMQRGRTTEALMREHATYVKRLAFHMLGSHADVDDVAQDVFLTLFRSLDRVRELGSVRAWLATTTARMVSRRWRSRRLRTRIEAAGRVDVFLLPAERASGEVCVQVQRLSGALDALPADSRSAWVLRYVEQEPMNDVARVCGCSLSTAKRRVASAQRVVGRALGAGRPGGGRTTARDDATVEE